MGAGWVSPVTRAGICVWPDHLNRLQRCRRGKGPSGRHCASSSGTFLKQVRWVRPWKCLLLSATVKWLKLTRICCRRLEAEGNTHGPGECGRLHFPAPSPQAPEIETRPEQTQPSSPWVKHLVPTPQANASPEHVSFPGCHGQGWLLSWVSDEPVEELCS